MTSTCNMRPNNPALPANRKKWTWRSAFYAHLQHFQCSAQPSGSTLKPIKPHSPAALVFKIIAATASHPRNESFYSDHAHATVMLAVPVWKFCDTNHKYAHGVSKQTERMLRPKIQNSEYGHIPDRMGSNRKNDKHHPMPCGVIQIWSRKQ